VKEPRPSGRSLIGRLDSGAWALLLAWLALAVDPSIAVQFTLPKLFGVYVLAPALAILWAARVWRDGLRVPPAWVAVCALALAAWSALSVGWAVHLPTALFGMHGRYNGLWLHLVLLAVFFLRATTPATIEELEPDTRWFVFVLVPVAGYALAQVLGFQPYYPSDRPPSTIGHPVILAAILCLGVPLIVANLQGAAGRRARAWWATLLLLFLAAILSTYARGPWLGLAIGLAVVGLGQFRRTAVTRPVALAALGLTLVLAAMAAGMLFRPGVEAGQMRTRLYNTLRSPMSDRSVRSRLLYYYAAAGMIRDHPYAGIGFESYAWLLPRYRAAGEDAVDNRLATMVHDGYLHVAVSAGLPALALYLGLIAAVLMAGWRAMQAATKRFRRALTLAMLGAIASYLVQDFSGWLEVSLTGFFWVLLGLSVSYSRTSTGDRRVRSWGIRAIATLAAAALTVGAAVLAARTAQEWETEAALAGCRESERQGEWNLTAVCLDGVVARDAGAARHLDDVALFYLRDLDRHWDSQSYARAAVLLDGAIRANPYDSYAAMHRVDLETVAIRRGSRGADPALVDAALRTAREADPTNPLVGESEARLRLAQGRTDLALAAVRKAQAVIPAEGRLRVLEGDVHQTSGETEAAIAAYREAVRRLPADRSLEARRKLSAVLTHAGRLEEALGEVDQAVALAPNDALCRTLLGIVHEGLGELHLARAAFEAALRVSPDDRAAREGLDRVTRMLNQAGGAEPKGEPSVPPARTK